jgi:hypothetical protein
MQGMLGGTSTGGLHLFLTLALALVGLGNLDLPLTGRGGWRRGLGGEE